MSSNDKKQLQQIEGIQSFVSLSSHTNDVQRKSIDPSAEVDEPHLLLEENIFSHKTMISKDKNSKGISTHFTNTLKKDKQSPQKSAPPSKEIINSVPSEQQTRRTVTFNDDKTSSKSLSKRFSRTSIKNLQLSNPNTLPNNQQEKDSINLSHSSDTLINSNQLTINTQDLNDLFLKDEYIAGGFANLNDELQEELLNDFADEFDDQITHRNRHNSSIRSSEHLINPTRSPIQLWQRARILLAIHLYQMENKTLYSHDNTSAESLVDNSSLIKTIDKLSNHTNEFEKLLIQKENLDERKIIFGLSIIQKYSLNSIQQYQCVDFYDVEQGYIIMCNIIKQSNDSKLLVYSLNKKTFQEIQSIEFDCSFQFNFMICIPIFRLLLGFINIKPQKSLMILMGDASRKGIFISKQEILNEIHSILYIHEHSMLFLGCLGRVFLYNTQSLQYTSQPLFITELEQLPFESIEPIQHICHIKSHNSIGILSNRYFILWQYIPNHKCLLKFCNPYRYDFIRCNYNLKYDYMIFGFIDGFILIYQLNQMKQIRRYQYHWKMITDLKNSLNEKLLLSSSIDQRINIWNLETLQHVYQYNTNEEIYQIDIIQDNLYYYRSLKNLIFFQLNLQTLLFSIINSKILSLKLFNNTQQTARILAILEDYSSILLSPVSGCSLTTIPNISKKPIKQILHDITRSHIYSLQFNGEIILYNSHNNPCIAEYKIQTKSEQYTITCMTLINPIRTHLISINTLQTSNEKSLEKQMIFFGHTNGYISLFQSDLFTMKPILAHKNSIICLETSRPSMDKSNILFTDCEVLLSSSINREIYLWDININKINESIELIHLLTIEQEKNISFESIKYLSMIDNFIIANYLNQKFLHLWQLLNISIRINDRDQWGIVEHPTKGQHHLNQIQAITATSKLKLFASSDLNGCIKIWDNTNSLIRELYFDYTLNSIEFLSLNGELILAYQNNIHLILPENYLLNLKKKFQIKQQIIIQTIAEDNQLEIIQPFEIPYQSLPIFQYNIKIHHEKKRLQRFERQLAGRYAVIESDDSDSEHENLSSTDPDRLSIVSDDPNWSELAEDVKDILRMKKYEIRHKKNK